jgi:hypothetical protein
VNAAQAFGKRIDNFWRSPETHAYTEALSKLPGMSGIITEAVIGKGKAQGTWGPQGEPIGQQATTVAL